MNATEDNLIQDGTNSDDLTAKENLEYSILKNYMNLNKLILRDLNNKKNVNPVFNKFSKDDIQTYLSDPFKFEKKLREAIRYIYGASSHFRRLIKYFVGLSDLAYIVEPYRIDPKKANVRIINNNYRKVLSMISSMDIQTQIRKMLTVCLRDDVCYITSWVTNDNITFQHLPSDYCSISTIEGNVANVTFNFSYFDTRKEMLPFYPDEFRIKYEQYQKNIINKWIELDSPTSFAIKCNSDIEGYPLPPFAGILREVYDIEDYKGLKLTKTALENYAMLYMKLPLNPDDGGWGIDLKKAREFWSNLDEVLPEEIGSVLSPMDIEKISFERANNGEANTVSEAEENLFTAAGVSSLLFNNKKASANALSLSIKADQAVTFEIVKNIETALNRLIQYQSYGKNFRINFLDVSPYNRKEMGDAYLKAASYGLPTISAYAASQGIGQAELDALSFLEGTVLNLQSMFKPIRNSAQMGSDSLEGNGATDEGGAPTKDIGELTDSGEQSSENKDDWG